MTVFRGEPGRGPLKKTTGNYVSHTPVHLLSYKAAGNPPAPTVPKKVLIAMMAASPVCGWIYDKYCPKNYATFGVFGVGLSFFLCGYGYATVNIWLVILALAIGGICRSIYQGPNTIEIMVSIPKEKAGVASSVLVILQDLGIMFGISAAAILLVLQLDALGYTGAVLSAGPTVLPPLFGNAMYIGGAICLISAAFSYRRDGGISPGPKP